MKDFTLKTMWQISLLALMLWREARGESDAAKIAVASTVMNRVAHPGWWGTTIDDVVSRKWQYSSMTDPNDAQLVKWPLVTDPSFMRCLEIAHGVVTGLIPCPLPGIDSYFDDSLQGDQRPKWAKEHPERFVGKVGRLNFFNMDCDTEDPHVVLKETEA